jgi:hypothetical protein
MKCILLATAALTLALVTLSLPAPILSSSAYAGKMDGNYGCSKGLGQCKTAGGPTNTSTTTTKKGNAAK